MRSYRFPKIAVMLSSYNGEKYISEQIESIFAQSEVDIDLFVRDDCSKDDTLNIIKSFIKEGKSIHLIEDHINLGPGLSFMTLLYYMKNVKTQYDYYAFADQDDIWEKCKLQKAVEKIEAEKEGNILYCSNQTLYINGQKSGLRYNYIPDLTLKGHVSKNLIAGCTFVFDRKMFENLTNIKFPNESLIRTRCHDSWIILEALLCGTVVYDENSYILYRIHDNNAVGIKRYSTLDRLKRFFDSSHQMRKLRSRTASDLLSRFPNASSEKTEVLKEFALYSVSNKYKKILMTDYEITNFTGENHYLFVIKVLLNYV